MTTSPAGDPVDMSQFLLGARYGSEDMYRDMGIVPGSRVAWEKDGLIYTDTVQGFTYRSAEPAIHARLSRWQRITRALTPMRWRKPVKPIRDSKPAEWAIEVGPVGDDVRRAYERHLASLQQAGEVMRGLIRTDPRETDVER